jgi:hypothetical protein
VLDDRVGETLVVVLDDGSGVADVVFEALAAAARHLPPR